MKLPTILSGRALFRLLFSMLALGVVLPALSKKRPAPVYIVAGQSNTDGRVPNDKLPGYIRTNGYSHCYWNFSSGTLSGHGLFEKFWPRIINRDNPNRWAYDAVTYYWLDRSLNTDFYIIKESLGGTAIDTAATSNSQMYWSASPDYLAKTSASDKGGKSLVKALTENIGACIDKQLSQKSEGYKIMAFIWQQGESDQTASDRYEQNLRAVIDYVRNYLVRKTGDKHYRALPVVIGGISHKSRGYSQGVEQACINLSKTMQNVYFVPVPNATLRTDELHFDAAGAELLGKKVYNQLVELKLAGHGAKKATLP